MRFLGFEFGNSKKQEVTQTPVVTDTRNYNFSSPFMKVGKGNLAMPYISTNYMGAGGYIRFGEDNLFPNLLRQLKHTSSLHGNIMRFINNATIGGGYEFIDVPNNASDKVKLYQFEKKIGGQKFLKAITQDALMFECINLLIENDDNGIAKSVKRLPMDEIRWNDPITMYNWNKDYSTNIGGIQYQKYEPHKPNHIGVLTFRLDDDQDLLYPIPLYSSANNWLFLSGEESYLQKSNIINSIFNSVIFKFPKKPANDEEAAAYKRTIESAKGAAEAGRAIAFFENGVENLPTVETMPTSNNDKLFYQTSERMDTVICQAWSIDPILMGIRVSGKLGSGSDIQQAYTIFEKNRVMPLRNELELVINELMDLFNVKGEFVIKNYQITNNEIKDKTEE